MNQTRLTVKEVKPNYPPPAAHETMRRLYPELDSVLKQVVQFFKHNHPVKDNPSLEEIMEIPAVKEYLELFTTMAYISSASEQKAHNDTKDLIEHIFYMVNFEYHQRKLFWVDNELAEDFAFTNLDIVGEVLELPFPTCAYVFNNETALALGKKVLEWDPSLEGLDGDPKAITVYLSADPAPGNAKRLKIWILIDAFMDRMPSLLGREVLIHPHQKLDTILKGKHPDSDPEELEKEFATCEIIRLLYLAINSTLSLRSRQGSPGSLE